MYVSLCSYGRHLAASRLASPRLAPRQAVLQAVAITMIITVGLTLYTMQSKYDFSGWGAWLCLSASCCLPGWPCVVVAAC